MKRETLRFKNKLIRERNRIERKGLRMIRASLKEQYKPLFDRIGNVSITDIEGLVEDMTEEPIKKVFMRYYSMFGNIALMQRKHLLKEKSDEDTFFISMFEKYMQDIVRTEAGSMITTITETSKKNALRKIREILADGEAEGLSVELIKEQIVKGLGKFIRGNIEARARAIAQTEMIKASNQAAWRAVDSTKLEIKKYWSSSHLPGVRDSHTKAEQDSISRGGLSKDEYHSNGLLYVGDPDGPAEEIINCRCTELYEVV